MRIRTINSRSCEHSISRPPSWPPSAGTSSIIYPPSKNCTDMDNLTGLQATLEQVYSQMLPLCSNLIGPAQGIAGFAALWYIASRVWRSIAAAEPIDFYPLLRPFALGIAIMLFPTVIALINGIMQPVVATTNNMVSDSNQAIQTLLQQKTAAEQQTQQWQMFVGADGSGDRDKWYRYSHPDDPNDQNEGVFGSV